MNNNTLICKINTPDEIVSKETYDFRVKELKRCRDDIEYFAQTYIKILTLDSGTVTIKMYPKQKEFLNFIKDENRCIAVAPRQSGKTVTYIIFCIWQTIFFPEKKILILGNKFGTAMEIMDRIRHSIEYLPNWIMPKVATWNKGEIEFENGSSIRGLASSSSAARGLSINCLIFDEFAFLPRNIADLIFTSTYPTISSSKNGKMVIVSTPNGTDDNLFYDLWKKANSGVDNDGWKPFKMHWNDVPGRDDGFKEKTISSIGQRRWEQEFACEFLTSSGNRKLIPDAIIDSLYSNCVNANKNLPKYSATLQLNNDNTAKCLIFEKFNPVSTYLASADIAEGTGKDYSVLQIYDITNLKNIKQVASFHDNKISVADFAYFTKQLSMCYANPLLICENNSIGSIYLNLLYNSYDYTNIVLEGSSSNILGIRSTATIKSRACLWLRDMLFSLRPYINWLIRDEDTINEMKYFISNGNSTTYQASNGHHDDSIICLLWCAYVLHPDIVEKYFYIADMFSDGTGMRYPLIIHPAVSYTSEELNDIKKSKLVIESVNSKSIQGQNTIKTQQLIQQQNNNHHLFQSNQSEYNNVFQQTFMNQANHNSIPYNNNTDISDSDSATPNYFITGDSDGFSDEDFNGSSEW